MKILGLGHSHIVAIADGCYSLQNEKVSVGGAPLTSRFCYLYGPEFTPAISVDGRLNANLVALIEQERPTFLILCLGGNEHIALSIVQSAERIDFILGPQPELPLESGATILPEAAIRETLRDAMQDTSAIMQAVRKATELPIAVIEPPPPLPDERVLQYPNEFFHRVVNATNLSPALFRYKLWRVQSELYRQICATCQMSFVPVAEEFIDPPGVLSESAWGRDASHANSLFGRRMIMRACETINRGSLMTDAA